MHRLILIFSICLQHLAFSQEKDSTLITIKSTNLSEDMSISLTKDDELLMIIYNSSDSAKELASPLLEYRFNFNDSVKHDSIIWSHQKNQSKEYLLFLIELDSDKTNLEIEPVFRLHYNQIINCFKNKNYSCLESYLGDEDLLGFQNFIVPSKINLNGRHKLDKYNYTIILE